MKITEGIYLVGSGRSGFSMTHTCDSHVYLIAGSEGCVMIDAGVGLEVHRIIDTIRADGIAPELVEHLFITHVHSDHAGGCAELKEKLGLKIYVPKLGAHLLRTGDEEGLSLPVAKADGVYPEDYVFPKCEPDMELSVDETFTFGNLNLRVIHTPGHSTDSMCYLAEVNGKRVLFSGDVVLHEGLLLFLNCPGSTMEGYRGSMSKLGGLGIDMLLPGHGAFVLNNGQEHVDKAIEALKHLAPPPAMW
ncbi:MBL fold metallo-hydrolase [Candidatus Latescibacterota bacterium]